MKDTICQWMFYILTGREQRRNEPFIPTCQAMAEALLPVIEDKIKVNKNIYVPYINIDELKGPQILICYLRMKAYPMLSLHIAVEIGWHMNFFV